MTPTNEELHADMMELAQSAVEYQRANTKLGEMFVSDILALGKRWRRLCYLIGALGLIVGLLGFTMAMMSVQNRRALAAHITERNADRDRDRHLAILNAKDDELTVMMRIDADLLAQALEDNGWLLAMMGTQVEAMTEMASAIRKLQETAVHVDPGGRVFIGPEQVLPPAPEEWPTDAGGQVIIFPPAAEDFGIAGTTGGRLIIYGEAGDDDPTTDTWGFER